MSTKRWRRLIPDVIYPKDLGDWSQLAEERIRLESRYRRGVYGSTPTSRYERERVAERRRWGRYYLVPGGRYYD